MKLGTNKETPFGSTTTSRSILVFLFYIYIYIYIKGSDVPTISQAIPLFVHEIP